MLPQNSAHPVSRNLPVDISRVTKSEVNNCVVSVTMDSSGVVDVGVSESRGLVVSVVTSVVSVVSLVVTSVSVVLFPWGCVVLWRLLLGVSDTFSVSALRSQTRTKRRRDMLDSFLFR